MQLKQHWNNRVKQSYKLAWRNKNTTLETHLKASNSIRNTRIDIHKYMQHKSGFYISNRKKYAKCCDWHKFPISHAEIQQYIKFQIQIPIPNNFISYNT